jgi:putative sterol carrier protein
MAQRNFAIDLDDATYQAALARAINEGKSLEQAVTEQLASYAKEGDSITTYTVQRGDTLSRIALTFYGDARKYPLIQQANNLPNAGNIWVGQVLVIPVQAGTPPTQPPVPPSPSPAPQPAPPPPVAPGPPPVPQPAPPAGPTLADYARAMPKGFRPDRAGGLKTTYQFQLGDGGGTWTISIANWTCTVHEGATVPPAVTVQMGGSDFIKLAHGQLNTVQAYQQGRLKVKGDLGLAAKISDIFGTWASAVSSTPTPARPPAPPQPTPPPPTPSPQPAPQPTPTGEVYPTLMNGSFDEYQPYFRDGENKFWKEPQFAEEYGKYWTFQLIKERKPRLHVMHSGTFGQFTKKYFGGSGLDYHQHGRYSQVITSRFGFDVLFYQTVAAQTGRDYTFKGMIVSFYKGTSGERADGKIFKTIGIDPSGGRDYSSPSVVWGERDGKDNEWRYPSLKVKAQTNAITVFIRLENTEKDVGTTELNIIHLERFELIA